MEYWSVGVLGADGGRSKDHYSKTPPIQFSAACSASDCGLHCKVNDQGKFSAFKVSVHFSAGTRAGVVPNSRVISTISASSAT